MFVDLLHCTHIFTTYDVLNVKTNPARVLIITNQLPVVSELSLNYHVLIYASCHLITCLCSFLTSHLELAGSFSVSFGGLTWGPCGLFPGVKGSWWGWQVTVTQFWPLDLRGAACRPPLVGPFCYMFTRGSLQGSWGHSPRVKGSWTGRRATWMQFWLLDLVGTGIRPSIVGPYCTIVILGSYAGPWDHCLGGQGVPVRLLSDLHAVSAPWPLGHRSQGSLHRTLLSLFSCEYSFLESPHSTRVRRLSFRPNAGHYSVCVWNLWASANHCPLRSWTRKAYTTTHCHKVLVIINVLTKISLYCEKTLISSSTQNIISVHQTMNSVEGPLKRSLYWVSGLQECCLDVVRWWWRKLKRGSLLSKFRCAV